MNGKFWTYSFTELATNTAICIDCDGRVVTLSVEILGFFKYFSGAECVAEPTTLAPVLIDD